MEKYSTMKDPWTVLMFTHFIIFFSESQARSLLSSDLECRRGTLKSGEILNNEGSMDCPYVHHFIIVFSESQARSLLSSDLECRRGTLKSGEILNNEGSMDCPYVHPFYYRFQ